MLQNLLRLTRNSLGYFVANFVSVFLAVIFLPLYTRFLTPADYGIISIAASVTAFLLAFLQLGLMGAYARFYFDFKHDTAELKRHISTIFIFLTFYGLLLTLLITFLGKGIQAFIPGVPFSPYIQLAIWSSYLSLLFQLRLTLYQTEQKAKQYAGIFIANVVFQTILTIVLVVVFKKGALGYITAGLASNFVFSLASLLLLRQYLSPIIDIAKLRTSLRYGLPLVPHMLGGWMFVLADRMILNKLVNTAETGLYSVGYQIGAAMNIVAMSINFAWSPFFMSQMKDKGDEAKGEVARFATYWVTVMCFVFLLLSLFSHEATALLTGQPYHGAYKIVPLVALGYLFGGFYYVVVNPLFWLGKTPLIAVATVTGGLLNVGLCFLFIPHMQMMGAALATALSNLYCFLFIAFFSLRSFKIPYEYKRLAIVLVITGMCYLLSLPVSHIGNIYIAFAVKLPIIAAFPILLILARFPELAEKKAVGELVKTTMSSVRTRATNLFGRFKGTGK
jgi:O-antigen/teichoic acid export membrane protein